MVSTINICDDDVDDDDDKEEEGGEIVKSCQETVLELHQMEH